MTTEETEGEAEREREKGHRAGWIFLDWVPPPAPALPQLSLSLSRSVPFEISQSQCLYYTLPPVKEGTVSILSPVCPLQPLEAGLSS